MFRVKNIIHSPMFYIFLPLLLWIGFSIVTRCFWFLTALFENYYINSDLIAISVNSCSNPSYARALPEACIISSSKLNVPFFIRAFNEGVISKTYSCIDYPCSEIIYSLTSSWIGIMIIVILLIMIISRIMNYIENLMNNPKKRKQARIAYDESFVMVDQRLKPYEIPVNNSMVRVVNKDD